MYRPSSGLALLRRLVLPLCLLAGCNDDLQPKPGDPPETPTEDGGDANMHHANNGDGTFTTTVDATSKDVWVALDLDTGRQVDATQDAKWDLAFQRFHIRARGGVNGKGGVEVATLSGADFAQLSQAPTAGYATDAADGDDVGTDPDTAFEVGDAWYSYDAVTHKLSPRDRVYVVRSDEGTWFKVRMLTYYDAAGTPAMLQLRWGKVQAPGNGELQVDASASDAWVYLQVGRGVVQVADSSTSRDWDIAVRRTQWRTNGGASGPGLGGARVADSTDVAAVQRAPSVGYAQDVVLTSPGPTGDTAPGNAVLGDWYDYDVNTHVVSPKARVFLVRTASGGYARLRITAYAAGRYTVQLAAVPVDVGVTKLTVDASDAQKVVGVRFGLGTVAALAADAPGSNWDISFSRTWVRTNSGTSGTGTAGAVVTEFTSLGEVTEAPTGPYVQDAMRPVAGPPGSGEASGNAVLGAWYDYDVNTHVVTPKSQVFVVRTIDGGFAKLRFLTYASGAFTLEYAWTGPGATHF
ncbi:hypothetical protein JGU66_10110 [Myxococcaceae bacterium JPH2]|nr:hypothetical protein [Myxococcaceae bacterium JPH2]